MSKRPLASLLLAGFLLQPVASPAEAPPPAEHASASNDGRNAFCSVPSHTDWPVLDQLGGVSVPVPAGASATLALLLPDGVPAGPAMAITQTEGELRLPAVGEPGQVFQLAIRGGRQEDSCALRLRIVAGAQQPGVAPPKAAGADRQEVAWETALHALRLVEEHGRAWSLEALRQLAPHRAVPEADQAHEYLARPNRSCANTESTEYPTRFDAPLLRELAKNWMESEPEEAGYL